MSGTYENSRNVSAVVTNTAGVAAATYARFARWKAGGADREIVLHVPAAAVGEPARGIMAMRSDTKNVPNGVCNVPLALPDGGLCLIELGEAVTTLDTPLRVGGYSTEVDGVAYLADASGDFIVGYPLQLGAVGDVIEFQFFNAGKVT